MVNTLYIQLGTTMCYIIVIKAIIYVNSLGYVGESYLKKKMFSFKREKHTISHPIVTSISFQKYMHIALDIIEAKATMGELNEYEIHMETRDKPKRYIGYDYY